MTSFSQLLLPLDLLIACLNVAVASMVACGIALAFSRRTAWTLPVRHTLLAASLAISLTVPLLLPLVHLPSFWVINVSSSVDQPLPEFVPQFGELIAIEQREEPTGTAPTAISGMRRERPVSAEPFAASQIVSPSDSTDAAPIGEQTALTPIPWIGIVGTLLCGLWFGGSAIGLARAMIGLARMRQWGRSLTVADSQPLTDIVRSAANNVGLKDPVLIYYSPLLPAPVTVGLLRPRIVLPAGIEKSLCPDELRAVIQHEMAHIARRDLRIGLLQRAATIVYWWNPLVLLADRRLADLREQICDDIAIRELPEPGIYATTLITLAERCIKTLPVPATLGIGGSHVGQLEGRIRRIMSSSETRCIRLTRLATVGVSAAVVLMTAAMVIAQVQVKSSTKDKIDKPAEQANPIAPGSTTLAQAPQEPREQPKPEDKDLSIEEFLAQIRNQKPQSAQEFEKLWKLAENDIERFGPGHVIFGRVVVEGENASRAVVVSQMRILPGGYFIDAVGPEERPLGFRLHGYEAVNVTPLGARPTENLGTIRMKPLPADRLASAKGLVQIESRAGAPRLEQVEATWQINANPVNTTHGGTRGSQAVQIKSKLNADGTFSISGLSPAKYTLLVRAPNCGVQFRRVEFTEGESKELEPITLEVSRRMNIEFTYSADCDFRRSKMSKATLRANQSWLSSGPANGHDEDLFIRQRDQQLVLSSSRQPWLIVDLGEAQLDELRDVAPDVAVGNNQGDLPAEDGHVYLVHHPDKKRWVLLRVTLDDKAEESETTAKQEKSKADIVTGQSDTKKAVPANRKEKTPLTGSKRQDRIKALLAWAIANDDEEHGAAALEALDELLELEPENADGVRLKEKIRKYYPDK